MTTIHRVPTDPAEYDWPLNKVWGGYRMPDELRGEPCGDCDAGQTYAAWWLQRVCQMVGMLASDVLAQERGRSMHPWLAEMPYPVHPGQQGFHSNVPQGWGRALDKSDPGYHPHGKDYSKVARPGPEMVELVEGLGMERSFMGDFNISDYTLYRKLVELAGVGESWGVCATCEGHGSLETYDGQRAEADAWEPTEPPVGTGWQAWEDVSEGSPISPVFETAEGLVHWFTTPASIWGARTRPLTSEQAIALVNAGHSIGSSVTVGGRMLNGDEAVYELGKGREA